MQPSEAPLGDTKVNIFRRDYAIAQILHAQQIELNRDRVACFLDTLTTESGEKLCPTNLIKNILASFL